MTGETQVLASAVPETQNIASLRYCCGIPLFQRSAVPFFDHAVPPGGDVWQTGRTICQNKANLRRAHLRLTADQEEGYVKRHEVCVCENKANLHQGFQVSSRKFQAGTPQFTVPARRPTRSLRAGPAVQNKANFREAQLRLTAGQEKGYVKQYELCVCENKANLPGRACSVPVRASCRGGPLCPPWATTGSGSQTHTFAFGVPVAPTPSRPGGPGAKQSQFPGGRRRANDG